MSEELPIPGLDKLTVGDYLEMDGKQPQSDYAPLLSDTKRQIRAEELGLQEANKKEREKKTYVVTVDHGGYPYQHIIEAHFMKFEGEWLFFLNTMEPGYVAVFSSSYVISSTAKEE
jgi:hypothetical protein